MASTRQMFSCLFATIILVVISLFFEVQADVVPTGHKQQEVPPEITKDKLAERDPELAQFLGVAQFVHNRLQEEGYAKGVLSDISISPNDPQDAGQSPYDWQKFLVLRVEEAALAADGGWRPATGHYEAIVHFSKARYAFPHAAVVQAWRLSGPEGARAERIEVALPPEPSWWESDGQKGFMVVCGAIACSALVRFIRVKFIDKLFGGGVKKPQEGEEVVGESTRLSSKDKINMKKGNKSSVSRKKKD